MVIQDEVTKLPHAHCNGCKKPAPPQDEVLAGNGLIAMGWQCSGGVHLCAACKIPVKEKRVNPPLGSRHDA